MWRHTEAVFAYRFRLLLAFNSWHLAPLGTTGGLRGQTCAAGMLVGTTAQQVDAGGPAAGRRRRGLLSLPINMAWH